MRQQVRWESLLALAVFVAVLRTAAAHAADWRVRRIEAPARVTALEARGGQVRVAAGGRWYAIVRTDSRIALGLIDKPAPSKPPAGALPDGRVTTGRHDVVRAWLSEPTDAYDHGVLGDRIEARTLVIETRDGKRHSVRLKPNAVFEDLEPRIADLDGDGHDDVIVVKSYVRRGSALAVIAARKGRYAIAAETPPLGRPHRWLDPVGIADFTGDGRVEVALVRQPHVIGALELWAWRGGRPRKAAEMQGFANHIIGTRAIDMAAVADFDGDGVADIALPALDRETLRIASFAPQPREIATVKLPAKAATDLALLRGARAPAVVLGLANGSLVVVERRE